VSGSADAAPRVFLLDNYDSFTWNLAQYLMELGAEVRVELNDRVTVAEINAGGWDAVVISPGPGRPADAGVTPGLVRELAPATPLLGVCLGHQALAEAAGARIVQAPTLMHGKTSSIRHDGRGVFANLEQGFTATRYHSLVVDRGSVPDELEVAAESEDGVIMGLRHRHLPRHGVQFHPESILTAAGRRLLANFLRLATGREVNLSGVANGGK